MKRFGGFKCTGCGSEDIKLNVADDGMGWLSAAGEESGFDIVVSLCCENCGRVYPVCRVRNFSDVSSIVERPE